MSPGKVTGAAEIRAIAAAEDPVVRNLRITECYWRLSSAMRSVSGEGANWCTFATWASRQAGCTIRGEDFGDRLGDVARGGWRLQHPVRSVWRALLRRGLFHPGTRLGRLVRAVHSPFDAFERATEAVAVGNRKVFEEIGYDFARYLELCGADGSARFDEFLAGLKPGPPPEGQDLLRSAFTHYEQARSEASPVRRAQWMLLANLEIGFHEQTRLQPEIARAMDAGPDTVEDLKRRLAVFFGVGWIRSVMLAVLAAPARAYQRFVRRVIRSIVSEALMVLRMPDRVLLLGSHLELPVPAAFGRVDVPELAEMVRSVEPDGCQNCGAEDWAELRQRMHYIFHLFRACHEEVRLFDAPFTQAQVTEFWSGRIPSGRL